MVVNTPKIAVSPAIKQKQSFRGAPGAVTSLNAIPPGQLVLPGLLVGNMAYKLGAEKNPAKKSELLVNSLISWAGGAAMATMHFNKTLPYYLLPALAGTIGIYQLAQKDTPQEKRDVLVNHSSWWLSGIAAQGVAKLANLKGPFQAICAFAVGASIAGPLISHFIREKIVPIFDKNKAVNPALSSFNTEYRVGNNVSPNFSPFSGATYEASSLASKRLAKKEADVFNPFDPYNVNQLIPGGFLK
jgi:hypothetical protein